MKILIDIGHPAHVHLFKHFALEMQAKGHKILFTARDKENEIYLLKKYQFQYNCFGKHYKSTAGKITGLIRFNLQMLFYSLKFKPDIYLSHGSVYAAMVSWFLRKPHISMEDTFNFEQIRLYKPFTSCILTSDYPHPNLGRKNIHYPGYHELAYLHPKVFQPDLSIIEELGIKNQEKYVIVRFVSWNASHDFGHKGISHLNKIELIKQLLEYAKVFISSESELPAELKIYKFPLSADKMHSAIAFSSLVYGESATMASEAAVLGVPAIYLDNTGRLYTREEEEKYSLVYNYSESEEDQLKSIRKAVEIISSNNQNFYKDHQKKLLSEKIDLTAFLIWFVENYPESFRIMKQNPDYQYKFK